MRARRWWTGGLTAVLVVGGCSSAGVDLFSGASDGEGTATVGTSSGSSGGGGGEDGTATTTASSSSSNSAASTASTSASSSSSSSSGGGVSIPCGSDTCEDGERCCVSAFSATQDKCQPADQGCGVGFAAVDCNGPMDCEGDQVCCGRYAGNFYTQVTCVDECGGGTGLAILMCGDDPGSCPDGTECTPSQTLPEGHAYCDE